MIFLPEDLPFCARPPPQDAIPGMEYFSRDALEAAVPPADRTAYLRQADKWVEQNGGHRFYSKEPEGNFYAIPSDRVPQGPGHG